MDLKPLTWLGSKWTGVERLLKRIPPHKIYVEPFFGAGGVFFNKERSTCEIINDNNDLLVNFFRVIKDDAEGFLEKFEWTLHSRTIFDDYKKVRMQDIKDPVEKAFVFYYLVKNSWCHLYRLNKDGYFNAPFGIPFNKTTHLRNHAFQFFNGAESIRAAHDRLKGVTIENVDYKKCIELYDSESTFFFFDPPYNTTFQYSGEDRFDHVGMEKLLRGMKSKWMLTLDGSQEMKDLFDAYHVEITRYRDLNERDKHVENIIVTNYDPDAKFEGKQKRVI